MKNLNTISLCRQLIALLLIMAISGFSAQKLYAQTYVGGSASIPSSGVASVYPLTVSVGATGSIASVTVSINLYHTWPDDIDILLEGPTGATSVLMSDAGGSTDIGTVSAGWDIVFDQSATTAIPDATAIAAGTYKPADYVTVGETFTAPAPAGAHTANLNNFAGTSPTGTWNLWIVDDTGGDLGTVFSWSLTITLAEPCVDPPTAGATSLTASTLCEGIAFTASLPDASTGEGQTYQWQSSADGVIWADIDGATGSSYTGVSSSTMYYRCQVTCGSSTVDSDPALLTVTPSPSPGNTSVDPIIISSLPYEADGNNLSANCWTNNTGNTAADVWYAYTADCDGTIDVYLCAAWDSYLRIYDESLTQLAFNDDTEPAGCGSLSSSITDFAVTAGTTYLIIVEGYSTNEGEYTLSVNPLN
ncbi:MAG: proprotein convertase P-domain-containing protein, partial [Chitinophagales bacterium]